MKQTIVAINSTKDTSNTEDNNSFLECAKRYGEVLTIDEFQRRYNADEIDFTGTFIRLFEAELEVKAVK